MRHFEKSDRSTSERSRQTFKRDRTKTLNILRRNSATKLKWSASRYGESLPSIVPFSSFTPYYADYPLMSRWDVMSFSYEKDRITDTMTGFLTYRAFPLRHYFTPFLPRTSFEYLYKQYCSGVFC